MTDSNSGFSSHLPPDPMIDRRSFLKTGACALLCAAAASVLPNAALAAPFSAGMEQAARRVSFRNTHTNEIFSGVYRVGNKYLPDAFDRINVVLRDFRSEEIFPIDPRVIDIIYTVHSMSGQIEPYEILSGYRCPKTNSMLRKNSEGVAKNSLHMTGQAIDLRLPGFSTRRIKDLACTLKAGGVGYYPKSDFVHMDTGIVRAW